METIDNAWARRAPSNKGKLVGQKAPLEQREFWASADCSRLGAGDRTEPCRVWNPCAAADQSLVDLSPDEEPPGRAVAAWAFEAGEHAALSRHRGRRRA